MVTFLMLLACWVYITFGIGFGLACDYEVGRRNFNDWKGVTRIAGTALCMVAWPFVLGMMVASYFSQTVEA